MAKQIEVIVNNLRLRETPSLSGKILGFASMGVHNYSEIKNADGYTWYHIENGWIAGVSGAVKELDIPQPVPKDESVDQVYVGDVILNIRTKPTTSSAKVGICDSYSYYNCIGFREMSDYDWYQIGDDAWIAGVEEVTYCPAGGSSSAAELKKEIQRLDDSMEIVLSCISTGSCSEYYDTLKAKLEDVNAYVDANFDSFKYDVVDSKEYDEIDLLYTADVHGAWVGYDEDGNYLNPVFNYDDISNYRDKLKKKNIKALLVDCGDWSRPCRVYDDYMNTGVMQSAKQMNKIGYLVSTCGNHEWRYPINDDINIEQILKTPDSMTACNILKNGKLLYKPYRTAKIGSKRIGIIGVGYPSANGKESYDGNGTWTYGEYQILDDNKLYSQIQKYIDELKKNGFDYIIVAGHMCKSTYESDSRYIARTDTIIKNTKGLTAVLQGHYNYATQAEVLYDKNNNKVLLAHESGANMNSFGRLQIKKNSVSSYLLDERSDLNVI